MIGSKKKFKVSAIVPRSDGTGEWFQKIGIAFENKDQSINAIVDLLPLSAIGPKGIKLHIREWTEADNDKPRTSMRGSATGPQETLSANEPPPF